LQRSEFVRYQGPYRTLPMLAEDDQLTVAAQAFMSSRPLVPSGVRRLVLFASPRVSFSASSSKPCEAANLADRFECLLGERARRLKRDCASIQGYNFWHCV